MESSGRSTRDEGTAVWSRQSGLLFHAALRGLPASNSVSPNLRVQRPETLCGDSDSLILARCRNVLLPEKHGEHRALQDSSLTRHHFSKCCSAPNLSPGDLPEMHVLGPHPEPPDPKLQVGPVVGVRTSPAADSKTIALGGFQNSSIF